MSGTGSDRARRLLPALRAALRKALLISLPSALLLVLVLEILFRTAIPACEPAYLRFDAEHALLTYDPGLREEGVFTEGNLGQQRSRWHINNEGWNSAIDYVPGKRGRPLVAIIGDSFVEGFHADVEDNMASVLRERLAPDSDVYGFGMSGAPLSQYLQMARYVDGRFGADLLVFVIIHNDFDESIRDLVPMPHMLQLTRAADGDAWVEATPGPYRPSGVRRLLSRSALVRYLMLNLSLETRLGRLFRGEGARRERLEDLPEEGERLIRDATHHLVARIRQENPGREIVFLVDGFRRAIHSGEEPEPWRVLLSGMIEEAGRVHGCRVLDLNPAFAEHFARTGVPLNSEYDEHWNAVGHRVAAEALLGFLLREDLLPSPPDRFPRGNGG